MREEIRALLAGEAGLGPVLEKVGDHDDLWTAGMTSMNCMAALAALENRLGVEFPDDLLRPRTFASVDALTAAVETLLRDGRRAAPEV